MMRRSLFPFILVFVVSSQLYAQLEPNPARFREEIDAYKKSDKQNPPPENPVLLIGSSSINIWKDVNKAFPGQKIINRGFGGSHTSDAIYYFDEIVEPYQPSKIVFYEGDNDIAYGKSPEKILAHFKKFVGMVEKRLPGTPLIFISIKPSPSRWHLADEMRKANGMIREYCEQNELLTYVDVFNPMLGENGRPKPEIFRGDSLHMNDKGYVIWESVLKPFLVK